MKPYAVAASLLAAPLLAIAAPDEEVVREVARRTQLPAAEIRAHYNACDSGVTMTMKICAGYRWVAQDVRLNQVYRQARTAAREAGHEPQLVQAQKAWLAYRDAMCELEGKLGAGGGSAEGLYVLSCKEQLTQQQADRLESATRR